ncbi:MAG: Ethanolamine utilization protein EutN/carboxysome structural protein Ccml, partial [Phycisphaerales bacterium]|nr:Ethanolamine utilization protein EutN/carboxysome structural protein Ccml [Phycisphaerales bacterium]
GMTCGRKSLHHNGMRIGKVIGRVTLSAIHESLVGGRFLIVEVQDRFALAGGRRRTKESAVVYDHMGAGDGDLIAFTESGEATRPFHPRRVPLDAYAAAILDTAVLQHEIKE